MTPNVPLISEKQLLAKDLTSAGWEIIPGQFHDAAYNPKGLDLFTFRTDIKTRDEANAVRRKAGLSEM